MRDRSNCPRSLRAQFLRENPGGVTERWLAGLQQYLERAVEHFGFERGLRTVEPKHLREWLGRSLDQLRGRTQRHDLHALSSVYRYA